jgi:hypothetical protein
MKYLSSTNKMLLRYMKTIAGEGEVADASSAGPCWRVGAQVVWSLVEVPSDTPVEEVQEGNFGVVHHEAPYVEDLKENFFHPFEGDPYLEQKTCVGAHS